ncbi:MAG: branched-chain amino acid ABC transporter substrate-binding protein [Alphaproteobacteria bacterium]|nr:branched-chain amino acid ABC transporter substrate-binding protein [Alphaproteobacteria bacterium]
MRPLLSTIVAVLALMTVAARAEILVGTAGPFSGPNAALGEQIRRGVQRAIDDINATGGLRGERLAMMALDDGCDPRKAIDVATQFVSSGVKFVAGHYCSGASIPASKIYEKAAVLQISPASSYGKLTDEGGWNVLRICPRDDAQGTIAGGVMAKLFPSGRIALLNDQSPASQALVAKARETLANASITPAVDSSYKPGAKDYAELAQMLRDSNANAVYFAGSYVESGIIARELRAMGSTAQFFGSDALLTDDFWKAAGDTAEGTLVTFMFDPQKFEAARAVIDRFKADDYAPEGHTLYAYAAVQAWAQAAEATQSTDSHRIADWLKAGNRVRTATGEVRFDQKGDLQDPQFAWFKWSGGRYTQTDPLAPSVPESPAVP